LEELIDQASESVAAELTSVFELEDVDELLLLCSKLEGVISE
jgi:hypothetical protein